MSIKITKEILGAIDAYMRDNGLTNIGLSEMLELSKSSASKWFSGKTKLIRPSTWSRLEPMIRNYLPQEYQRFGTISQTVIGNTGSVNQTAAVESVEKYRLAAIKKVLETPEITGVSRDKILMILAEVGSSTPAVPSVDPPSEDDGTCTPGSADS